MERLLTEQEILLVTEQAKNPIYQQRNAIFMYDMNSITSILGISEKGLILIEGNKDTGFTHIKERHDYHTERIDWIKNKNSEKTTKQIDNPSKFSKRSIPILDYTKIIDDIFCVANKEISKDPEKFDKYAGTSAVFEDKELKFHLVLYKDTKIVHTLFPNKKNFNKKIIINLVKGKIIGEIDFANDQILLTIPYTNDNGIERYVVIFRTGLEGKEGKVYIQVNLLNGAPHLTTIISDFFTIPKEEKLDIFLMRFDAQDFSTIEKIMKAIENDIFNNEL